MQPSEAFYSVAGLLRARPYDIAPNCHVVADKICAVQSFSSLKPTISYPRQTEQYIRRICTRSQLSACLA